MTNPRKAIAGVTKAVEIRGQIYYLGGGWPHPSSKGRMEAALDNVAELYRILAFIGKGELVEKHLAEHGITIKLDPKHRLDVRIDRGDRDRVREIITFAVDACLELQKEICQLADIIKDDLRPMIKRELEIKDEEYRRLYGLARVIKKRTDRSYKRFAGKKVSIEQSLENFETGLVELKRDA